MLGTYDVIIAGAGPVGLFLATELALASTTVLVLERDPSPTSAWKVAPLGRRGLNTPSIESLYRRGLLPKLFPPDEKPSGFLSDQQKPAFKPAGHFSGIMLDAGKMALKRWKYKIEGPSLRIGPTTLERLDEVLVERAEGLGVKIQRGCGVSGVEADEQGVNVHAGEGRCFRAKWLVGCDGGRSAVR